MSRLTAAGAYTVIGSGFIAYGDSDPSEGRGGHIEIGRFSDVEEAVHAARGRGVQGDSGYVSAFEYRLYEGGLLVEHAKRVFDRRECMVDNAFRPGEKMRAYLVGWVKPDGSAADSYAATQTLKGEDL